MKPALLAVHEVSPSANPYTTHDNPIALCGHCGILYICVAGRQVACPCGRLLDKQHVVIAQFAPYRPLRILPVAEWIWQQVVLLIRRRREEELSAQRSTQEHG